MARSSLMTHPVDTSLVVIYPVDHSGNPVLNRKPKSDEPKSRYPSAWIVTVDSERCVVTSEGTLIERWKADHILDSLVYKHTFDEYSLSKEGLTPNDVDWNNRIGTASEQCKFAMREPTRQELLALTAPIDEGEFTRVAKSKPEYILLAKDYGDAIKAAMRANPSVPVNKLFEAFNLAFTTNKNEK